MKIFNNIRNYIDENEFKIYIYKNKIDIINFDNINDVNDNEIVINDNKIVINGKNLKVNKLINNEALIIGNIEKVLFNE